MGLINRNKPKRQRPRKTLQEKIDRLAEKRTYELFKRDPALLDQYIAKKLDIVMAPESERLMEQFKIQLYSHVADSALRDPTVIEAFRDKLVSEITGLPHDQSRDRGKGGYPRRANPQNQLENIKHQIRQVKEIQELLGPNDNSWVMEILKAALPLLPTLLGSSGQATQSNAPLSDQSKVYVEVDGQVVEMGKVEFQQYAERRKQLAKSNLTIPTQGDQESKEKTAGDNMSSEPPAPLPSTASDSPSTPTDGFQEGIS